jgi:hypothetical protein
MQFYDKIRSTKIFIYYFFTLIISLYGCSDDRPIQGFDLADPAERGEVINLTLSSIELEETFRDTTAATGASAILSLGLFDNREARILLKYENIPDTLLIVGASIVLFTRNVIGESMQPFTATIHQVTNDWEEFSVTDETFQNSFDANVLGTASIFPTVGDTSAVDSLAAVEAVRIDFDNPQLVIDWVDSTSMVDNYGVLINFSNSNFIKDFFSINNDANQPRLELYFLRNGSERDTTFTVASADAFLVRSLTEPSVGPLYVDNVFSRQSIVKFDLSSIPRESTINKAILQLNVKRENSILTNDGVAIQIIRLAEPFIAPNVFKTDSLFNPIVALVKESETFVSIPIRTMLQAWTSLAVENHGFLIKTGTPGRDVSRVSFFSSAVDPSLAPKITIDYTVAPEVP